MRFDVVGVHIVRVGVEHLECCELVLWEFL